VSVYANPEFAYYQMKEIREGLEQKLDVSAYAKPEYSWDKMCEIRERLEAAKNKEEA
jgi:hypothetical protein